MLRYRIEPDLDWTLEDMAGDMFCPKANPEIDPNELKRRDMEYRKLLEEDGVWGFVIEEKCTCCGEWSVVDSCWGFDDRDYCEKEAIWTIEVIKKDRSTP